MKSASRTRGFSLVELVIVVVIIGVIAAIAVPRISRGAKGAVEASVKGSLAGLRNAIDMFAAEHGGAFPGSYTGDVEADFIAQLTSKTNASGVVGTTAGTHIYGPYLRSGVPPLQVGPNKGANGVILTDANPPVVAEGTVTAGWVYNYETGVIIANTDDEDESETGYDEY